LLAVFLPKNCRDDRVMGAMDEPWVQGAEAKLRRKTDVRKKTTAIGKTVVLKSRC
jgi:hypothetical protein